MQHRDLEVVDSTKFECPKCGHMQLWVNVLVCEHGCAHQNVQVVHGQELCEHCITLASTVRGAIDSHPLLIAGMG